MIPYNVFKELLRQLVKKLAMKATQVLELDIEDAKQKQFQEGLVKDGKCRAHIRTLQRFL